MDQDQATNKHKGTPKSDTKEDLRDSMYKQRRSITHKIHRPYIKYTQLWQQKNKNTQTRSHPIQEKLNITEHT